MTLSPSFEEFEQNWKQGKNQLVWARLAADLDTPVSLMLKLGDARKDTFMLESVTGGEVRGRYSIVGMKPDLIWRCHGTASEINREARFDANAFAPLDGHPLATLRALIAECSI
ncbi:MAG: anthranilate synthase component I, partial [Cypionkella sp.]|nr:anthranilate synthase component I [Cypionkella sp.]